MWRLLSCLSIGDLLGGWAHHVLLSVLRCVHLLLSVGLIPVGLLLGLGSVGIGSLIWSWRLWR